MIDPSTIDMSSVSSSDIASIGYDATDQVLQITFNDGQTYQYSGVPQSDFDGLMAADSKGSYAHSNIFPAYSYEKIS